MTDNPDPKWWSWPIWNWPGFRHVATAYVSWRIERDRAQLRGGREQSDDAT
jgi:hypothetical protein